MNEKDFKNELHALSERVLSKALTPDDETNYTESLFESIRHVNEYGEEFWFARELQVALEYKWRNFKKVLDKAIISCLGRKEIHAKKGLKKSQDILDHMGSTELAANLFRATQTDEKLRRENITGKEATNRTHYEVGKKERPLLQQ